ncbi:antibiotic biosynthesis monooxygenase family protein [Photobacterium leiognathi]|uniref:antibiotic biosynthesis monooxygenase family protein n=1 Tax=Photobacterium leiognathi TaxID=553611 RepID=UPI000AA045FA|nr:antibiotic biosynthesis monooxygenase [Photobacterium leiognathi]
MFRLEQEFINIRENSDTDLDTVQGFQSFNLLQGASNNEFILFASHSVWDSRQAFEDWTQSEAFRRAHTNARDNKEIYLGAPNFEGVESCL